MFQNVRDLEIHNYLIKYLKIKENKKKGRQKKKLAKGCQVLRQLKLE